MEYIVKKLNKIKESEIYRELKYIETAQSSRVKINGKNFIRLRLKNYRQLYTSLNSAGILCFSTFGQDLLHQHS
ncbi:hypothetical protein ACMXKO_01755 [Clostridium tyrobutyricum]|uniref:hypothetical protein n=1 Tax=Clostridium tyrobutyricum TaxID=1519 RepID=UPI0039F6E2F9